MFNFMTVNFEKTQQSDTDFINIYILLNKKLIVYSNIHITDNRHFVFVYLLGKLDYSLYGQRNKNRVYIFIQ